MPGVDLPQSEVLRRHFPQIPAHGAGKENDQKRRPAHQQRRHAPQYRVTAIPACLGRCFLHSGQRREGLLHPVMEPCEACQHGQRLPHSLQTHQPQRQGIFQRRPAIIAVQPHAEGVYHAEDQGEHPVRRRGTELPAPVHGVIQQGKAKSQRAPQVAGAAGGRIADALIVFSADDKAHGAQRAERGAKSRVSKTNAVSDFV